MTVVSRLTVFCTIGFLQCSIYATPPQAEARISRTGLVEASFLAGCGKTGFRREVASSKRPFSAI